MTSNYWSFLINVWNVLSSEEILEDCQLCNFAPRVILIILHVILLWKTGEKFHYCANFNICKTWNIYCKYSLYLVCLLIYLPRGEMIKEKLLLFNSSWKTAKDFLYVTWSRSGSGVSEKHMLDYGRGGCSHNSLIRSISLKPRESVYNRKITDGFWKKNIIYPNE